jgi:putative SOS response-associated peptidase YedK
MCGRFSLSSPPGDLARRFDAELAPGIDPEAPTGWNLAPTDAVLGICARAAGGPPAGPLRAVARYHWGLDTGRAKGGSGGGRLFNARAETVAARPTFKEAFARRRLAVPADGFFEWRKGHGGKRQAHFFHRADGAPLLMAGLWEPGRTGALPSCTVVTTAAGPDMDGVHDRMPVVLEAPALDVWLDPDDTGGDRVRALLRAGPPGTLVHHVVDPRVGNVANRDPGVVEPVGPARPGAATR